MNVEEFLRMARRVESVIRDPPKQFVRPIPILTQHDPTMTICGVRVVPSELVQPVPVLKISDNFPHVSEKFRAEWNAWALERFGTVEVCYLFDGKALGLGAGILMNPRSVVKLENYT